VITAKKQNAERLYYLLGALFIAALITCNLIANKFVTVDLGFKVFTISAGVLPYPLTFLITDILSELYGQKRTTQVVLSGLVASIFVLFVLWLGAQFPAIEGSPVSDATYNQVFQNAWRVIAASMLAYIIAQLIDVRLFHFWKNLTGGKMLWVRNNFYAGQPTRRYHISRPRFVYRHPTVEHHGGIHMGRLAIQSHCGSI